MTDNFTTDELDFNNEDLDIINNEDINNMDDLLNDSLILLSPKLNGLNSNNSNCNIINTSINKIIAHIPEINKLDINHTNNEDIDVIATELNDNYNTTIEYTKTNINSIVNESITTIESNNYFNNNVSDFICEKEIEIDQHEIITNISDINSNAKNEVMQSNSYTDYFGGDSNNSFLNDASNSFDNINNNPTPTNIAQPVILIKSENVSFSNYFDNISSTENDSFLGNTSNSYDNVTAKALSPVDNLNQSLITNNKKSEIVSFSNYFDNNGNDLFAGDASNPFDNINSSTDSNHNESQSITKVENTGFSNYFDNNSSDSFLGSPIPDVDGNVASSNNSYLNNNESLIHNDTSNYFAQNDVNNAHNYYANNFDNNSYNVNSYFGNNDPNNSYNQGFENNYDSNNYNDQQNIQSFDYNQQNIANNQYADNMQQNIPYSDNSYYEQQNSATFDLNYNQQNPYGFNYDQQNAQQNYDPNYYQQNTLPYDSNLNQQNYYESNYGINKESNNYPNTNPNDYNNYPSLDQSGNIPYDSQPISDGTVYSNLSNVDFNNALPSIQHQFNSSSNIQNNYFNDSAPLLPTIPVNTFSDPSKSTLSFPAPLPSPPKNLRPPNSQRVSLSGMDEVPLNNDFIPPMPVNKFQSNSFQSQITSNLNSLAPQVNFSSVTQAPNQFNNLQNNLLPVQPYNLNQQQNFNSQPILNHQQDFNPQTFFNQQNFNNPQHFSASANISNSSGNMLNQNNYYDSNSGSYSNSREPFNNPASQISRPIVAFGFGGKIVLVYPQRKNRRLNARSSGADLINEPVLASESRPGLVKVSKIGDLLSRSDLVCSLRQFPGPLHPKTDKTELLKYISLSSANVSLSMSGNTAINARLLWDLLKCLCVTKPVDGKNKPNESLEAAIVKLLINNDDAFVGNVRKPSNSITANNSNEKMKIEAINRIQAHLLVGEREDACRIAVENSLWTHAMLIASHMDVNAYRQIVSKFALSQLSDGTPLQSLYLLFADHPSQLFNAYSNPGGTSYGIVENWRKNLAMLISNPTSSDRNVKNQLGDLLISKHGQVEAAHFCYIISDEHVDFTSRLALVGSDHRAYPRTFHTNFIALQQSEIYEHARITNPNPNPNSSNPFVATAMTSNILFGSNLIFKFYYAGLLCDMGESEKALKYADTLLNSINSLDKKKFKGLYSEILLQSINEFESRLRQCLNISKASSISTQVAAGVFSIFDKGLNFLMSGSNSSPSVNEKSNTPHIPSLPGTNVPKANTPSVNNVVNSSPSAIAEKTEVKKEEEKSKEESIGGGLFGSLKKMLGVKEVKQAILEQDSEFYYDPVKKRWVEKGAPEVEDVADISLPPPPPQMRQQNNFSNNLPPPNPNSQFQDILLSSNNLPPSHPGMPSRPVGGNAPRAVTSRYAPMPGYDAPPAVTNYDNPPQPQFNNNATLPSLPTRGGGYSGKVFTPKVTN